MLTINRNKNILVLFMVLPFIWSCGDDDSSPAVVGDGSPVAATCVKQVASTWFTPDLNLSLDLTGFQLNTPTAFDLNFQSGEQCTATVNITGDGCTGTWVVTSANYAGGGAGDPGCSQLIGTDTYSIVGSIMTVCDASVPTECAVYN